MPVTSRAIGLALLVAFLVAIPSLPPGSASAPAAAAPHATSVATAPLPSALEAPWSARAGFDPAYAQEVLSPEPATGPVRVSLTLWPASTSFFLPASSKMSPTALASEYGVSPSTYSTLERYFTDHGLTVEHTWSDRLALTVDGTAGDVAAAFGTQLMTGTWEGRSVRYPATIPTLPAALAGQVAAVSGLSDGFSRFSFSLAPAPVLAGPAQGRTSTFITPSAAHLLYGMSALYNLTGSSTFAQGKGIALVLWGDGYAPSDIQTFFTNYYPAGFPAVSFGYINVDGAPAPSESAPSDPSQAPQELTLDMEWAGSAAPGATLTAVYAPDGPVSNGYSPSDAALEDALRSAVDLSGVDAVSMSFGTPDGGDAALQAAFAVTLGKASQLGITVLAASGDTGGAAKSGCQGGISPDFPATSTQVLAVGGTAPVESLDALGDVVGLDSEPAWNGSGGGYSTSYAAPSWQTTTAPPVAQNGQRGIPDVAGPAYDNFFYFGGAQRAGRGTSFATPMWAGLVVEIDTLLGHTLGTVAPRIYSIGQAVGQGKASPGLVDITTGANCIAAAGAGWDAVTGWGSPRAVALFADLSSSFVNVGLTSSASSVVPGGSLSATASITNVTTRQPIPGLTVAFTLTAPSYSGPCGGTLASTTATTDGNGTATSSLSIPGCFLGGSALLTVTIASGGYFGTNSTTVGVNLVGLAGFLAFIQVFPYNVVTFVVIVLVAVGIGYWIGERRRPRNPPPMYRRPPPAAPASPAVAPPLAATPPLLPTSPAGPPVSAGAQSAPISPGGSVDGESYGALPPMPVVVPDHVLSPPPAPPALELPAVNVRRCPNCQAAVGASESTCPDCGAALPPSDVPSSAS
ncbi:MAG TPA: protease pro-enzyme activation domain-containing protein [Thermoplasmata archaeon]|nr:protease pro-enzyme activation domain-containing protein [Thermoplasmata archaeon]